MNVIVGQNVQPPKFWKIVISDFDIQGNKVLVIFTFIIFLEI
jgi:hypothetical protein